MKPYKFGRFLALFTVILTGNALAVPSGEFADVQARPGMRIEANEPVADCVTEVQAVCLTFDAPGLTGADCYRRANDHWGATFFERMQVVRQISGEEVAAFAMIEVIYDLKGNFRQSDRLGELSLVRKHLDDENVYFRICCQATAVGQGYARHYSQPRKIN